MNEETFPTAPGVGARPEPAEQRTPLRKNPFFWAALAAIITIPLLRPLLRHVPDPPPVIGQLPAYALVDQDGEPFGSETLRGQVYIVNMFFSTCRSVCPPLMRTMAELQRRLERESAARGDRLPVRLVSVTVDPAHDTPERLRAIAAEYGADARRWTFLTGDEAAVRALVVGGLMTDMGEREVDPADVDLIEISHTTRLVLVDDRGQIRGYYGSDETGADEAYHRAVRVADTMGGE